MKKLNNNDEIAEHVMECVRINISGDNYFDLDYDDIHDLIQGHIEENLTLEMVEDYAEYWDLISSEQALSDRFDSMVDECDVTEKERNDSIAMTEWFNNWTDSLCKEGEIHELQYNEYEYVGKYQ